MRFATLSFSLVVIVLLNSTVAAQERFPTLNIERRGSVPNSLEQAIKESELVVLIRVVGEQDRTRGLWPGTGFRAQVLEVIKNAERSVGPEISIHRDGGLVNSKGAKAYIEERGFPLWRPGMTLVAFLFWNEDQNVFYLANGPESSIEQAPNGKAKTFGRGRAAKDQDGKPFDEVLARIRSAVR